MNLMKMDFGFFQHDIELIKSFIQYFKKMSGYVVPSDPLSMLFNVSFTPTHRRPPPSFSFSTASLFCLN